MSTPRSPQGRKRRPRLTVDQYLAREAQRAMARGRLLTLAEHIQLLSLLTGKTVTDLTVLAATNDPFRQDTPTKCEAAQWFAGHFNTLVTSPRIHNRGVHYLVLGQIKPDGTTYGENLSPAGDFKKDRDWDWLQDASKSARWLDLVDPDRIIDQRSDIPTVRRWSQAPDPTPSVSLGEGLYVPGVNDDLGVPQIEDFIAVDEFARWTRQRYHLILVGEKSSLFDVLDPIARRYQADLYLPTGDISISFVNDMLNDIVRDGRPAIIFMVADADPSGWGMPIALTRKLQALKLLKLLKFTKVDFRVYRAGLTPKQVHRYKLDKDTIDLKESETREPIGDLDGAVEVDAMMALRPGALEEIVTAKLDRWFDHRLAQRVDEARNDWLDTTAKALDKHLGKQGRQRRDEITARLQEIRDEIRRLINEMASLSAGVKWPNVVPPEPECDGDDFSDENMSDPELVCNSRWPFLDQVLRLIRSRKREDAWEDDWNL